VREGHQLPVVPLPEASRRTHLDDAASQQQPGEQVGPGVAVAVDVQRKLACPPGDRIDRITQDAGPGQPLAVPAIPRLHHPGQPAIGVGDLPGLETEAGALNQFRIGGFHPVGRYQAESGGGPPPAEPGGPIRPVRPRAEPKATHGGVPLRVTEIAIGNQDRAGMRGAEADPSIPARRAIGDLRPGFGDRGRGPGEQVRQQPGPVAKDTEHPVVPENAAVVEFHQDAAAVFAHAEAGNEVVIPAPGYPHPDRRFRKAGQGPSEGALQPLSPEQPVGIAQPGESKPHGCGRRSEKEPRLWLDKVAP
jgi:hypothetical protein